VIIQDLRGTYAQGQSNICDIPTYPLDVLKQSQDGIFSYLDFSTLSPGYASKEGIFHPNEAAAKAKACRQWLRARSEDHIAGKLLIANRQRIFRADEESYPITGVLNG
jgi:hypothetical protein